MIVRRIALSLMLIVCLGATGVAEARVRSSELAVGGGLLIGPGIDLNGGPTALKLNFRGWLTAMERDQLELGLVLPFGLGFSGRSQGNVDISTTLFELAPSARVLVALNEYVRPYFDFGPGFSVASTETVVRIFNLESHDTDSRTSILLRIAVGVEILPLRKQGLVLMVEPVAMNLRFFGGATQAEYGLLFGAGYQL
ncbi:MAG: hypothetical protein IRZ16_12710 [Myxococcaceae bacterium]|nr:hypothetical protein [Myxococcaceae bacterium]